MDKIRCRLAIYAYYIKEPTIQVERAYTPLFMMHKIDPTMLHFTIKRYGSGELSRYLYRIPTGATVSLRGPELTWKLDPSLDVPKEVVMLVAGTGVTTAHQLLSNVYDKAPLPATPKISVLYAARSMDDLLLIPELAEYQKKYPGKVKLHIWTESEPSSLHVIATVYWPTNASTAAIVVASEAW
ncbi:cyc2-cytochrome-c mitochondrial import factor [Malassezia pachydermatis]|uniref:Cyc2-cytochrome-c mitochondrial import factor n=1 Tax=Malassezia pachydermatis TaxID=77020 RepID=A0A0M9VPZ0_9BASI|nr:cyc2-cytochrome-c mitochondrial import factor [Malassezia pachydermatis]KOS14902.1 cyc2-cytochrome-c mitochondrial import factor [Malassezia pachydermatis]